MCQILFSKTANPPREAIFDANEMNKDGFGFAWTEGNVVKWDKGHEAKDLSKALMDRYLALPFPKAIHFRLATHGGVIPELTHPFPIKRGVPHDLTGSAKAVLFHNGIWHDYDDRLREGILAGTINPNVLQGGMSDSRAMAVLAQRFGEDFMDLLSLGSNKVLVLRHDTWYTYGNWTEKEGWSASNSKIFRSVAPTGSRTPTEKQRAKWARKGLVLDSNGFPVRGGRDRGRGRGEGFGTTVAPSEGRSVEVGSVDEELPTLDDSKAFGADDDEQSMIERMQGSKFKGSTDAYLSHDYGQVQEALAAWAKKGERVL